MESKCGLSYYPIVYSIFGIAVFLVILYLTITFQFGFAQVATSSLQPDATSVSSTNISGTYRDPVAGFEIQLPEGWSGPQPSYSGEDVRVSPGGYDLSSTADIMKISVYAKSYINKEKLDGYNASSYEGMVKKIAEGIGCKVTSDTYVKINGINSKNITEECGDYSKAITFQLATDKNLIFLRLDTVAYRFDDYLPKFAQSVKTIKIDKPGDIQADIAELSKVDLGLND